MTFSDHEWFQRYPGKVVLCMLQNDIVNYSNTMNLFWNWVKELVDFLGW